MALPGPSRRIIVEPAKEPLTIPERWPAEPAKAPPPEKKPTKEPVPA